MRKPTLVVVSGPPGTGKTTLAHLLAREIGCPAICRDEIKEGMAHGVEDFVPSVGDALTKRTLPVFFGVVRAFGDAGVTTVAEAAFQDGVWRAHLSDLEPIFDIKVVQCSASDDVVEARLTQRANTRTAHADADALTLARSFVRLSAPFPTITVDTTDGYRPPIDEVIRFANT